MKGRDRSSKSESGKNRAQFSLAQILFVLAFLALGAAYTVTVQRLRSAQEELFRLRSEVGYLDPTGDDQIAAVRLSSDEPLTYRLRIRVPSKPRYRLVYSTLWPSGNSGPTVVRRPSDSSRRIARFGANYEGSTRRSMEDCRPEAR